MEKKEKKEKRGRRSKENRLPDEQNVVVKGFSRHRLYRICYNAYCSCNRPSHHQFKSYNELGIKFKFESVQDMIDYMLPIWCVAMRKYPNKKLCSERIDISKGFEPGNMRIIPCENRKLYFSYRHKNRDYSKYNSRDRWTDSMEKYYEKRKEKFRNETERRRKYKAQYEKEKSEKS